MRKYIGYSDAQSFSFMCWIPNTHPLLCRWWWFTRRRWQDGRLVCSPLTKQQHVSTRFLHHLTPRSQSSMFASPSTSLVSVWWLSPSKRELNYFTVKLWTPCCLSSFWKAVIMKEKQRGTSALHCALVLTSGPSFLFWCPQPWMTLDMAYAPHHHPHHGPDGQQAV